MLLNFPQPQGVSTWRIFSSPGHAEESRAPFASIIDTTKVAGPGIEAEVRLESDLELLLLLTDDISLNGLLLLTGVCPRTGNNCEVLEFAWKLWTEI